MALDALYIAYSKQANPPNAGEVRAAINALFQQLENPSAYNADQFASSLKRIHDLLHEFYLLSPDGPTGLALDYLAG